MGIPKLKKNWRVEYNLNADDGLSFEKTKEFYTMMQASACAQRWFQKSARGGMMVITRIGDRV